MFMNTLSLTKSTYKKWSNRQVVTNDDENIPPNTTNKRVANQTKAVDNIKKWLNLLPVVLSHYCRSQTNKRYVESSFLFTQHMLSVFSIWCTENNVPIVNRNLFSNVLKAEKVSIHHPGKDQCDICVGFKCGTIGKEVYDQYITRKDQAKIAKNTAKGSASETTLVLTMDLQSVLLCPKLLASAVYYKQKLQLHNFTLYVLNNADVTLYAWHEADGGVTANEFTSCIINYLENLPPQYNKIILISDGCNYQNRNRITQSKCIE